jgi:hypothetical protein
MRKPQGYAFTFDLGTGDILKERDTFTCSHCNKITHVVPFCDPADLGGYCSVCDKLVCKDCAYLQSLGKPCTPFMERLARMETHLERGGKFRDVDTFAED